MTHSETSGLTLHMRSTVTREIRNPGLTFTLMRFPDTKRSFLPVAARFRYVHENKICFNQSTHRNLLQLNLSVMVGKRDTGFSGQLLVSLVSLSLSPSDRRFPVLQTLNSFTLTSFCAVTSAIKSHS